MATNYRSSLLPIILTAHILGLVGEVTLPSALGLVAPTRRPVNGQHIQTSQRYISCIKIPSD